MEYLNTNHSETIDSVHVQAQLLMLARQFNVYKTKFLPELSQASGIKIPSMILDFDCNSLSTMCLDRKFIDNYNFGYLNYMANYVDKLIPALQDLADLNAHPDIVNTLLETANKTSLILKAAIINLPSNNSVDGNEGESSSDVGQSPQRNSLLNRRSDENERAPLDFVVNSTQRVSSLLPPYSEDDSNMSEDISSTSEASFTPPNSPFWNPSTKVTELTQQQAYRTRPRYRKPQRNYYEVVSGARELEKLQENSHASWKLFSKNNPHTPTRKNSVGTILIPVDKESADIQKTQNAYSRLWDQLFDIDGYHYETSQSSEHAVKHAIIWLELLTPTCISFAKHAPKPAHEQHGFIRAQVKHTFDVCWPLVEALTPRDSNICPIKADPNQNSLKAKPNHKSNEFNELMLLIIELKNQSLSIKEDICFNDWRELMAKVLVEVFIVGTALVHEDQSQCDLTLEMLGDYMYELKQDQLSPFFSNLHDLAEESRYSTYSAV